MANKTTPFVQLKQNAFKIASERGFLKRDIMTYDISLKFIKRYIIPHIFHGMTKSISVGEIGANGEIVGFSEHKLYAVKYALYLDQGIIAIFDDNNQQHLIVQYIGSEDADGDTCYLFATSDQNKELGYVEFNYTNDGGVLLIIDYPKYAMGYFLETYIPEEEFAKRLKERYNR